MEKENEKFPVNQTKVSGLIVSYVTNEETNRTNAKVLCQLKDKKHYVNVLFSGDHNKKFVENMKKFHQEVGEEKKPLIKLQGEAYFSKYESNGVTHQNFSVIASSNFEVPITNEEFQKFRQTNNSNNPENLQVQIRAAIVKDIDQKGKEGKTFGLTSIKHTYITNDEPKQMYANVVIPNKINSAIKTAEFKKGANILLTGVPQQQSWDNAQGAKVYSFNIIANQISHDKTQTVTYSQAAGAIKEVAQEITPKTKKADKEKIVEDKIDKLKNNSRGM